MNIISLGLGVQSVALYYMSSTGQLPRADQAIVADTGREKSATYAYLELLRSWQHQHGGIPILVKTDRNLFQDLLAGKNSRRKRFSSIPAFTQGEDGTTGMLMRQCTGEYKIQVVDDAIREIYGLPKGARRPITHVWKGITTDEMDRMDQPASALKVHVYPFVGYEFDRRDWRKITWARPVSRINLLGWYRDQHLPIPEKSACVFSPYQSAAGWAQLKQQAPDDFAAAVQVDEAIRNSTHRGVRAPCYLHRSLQPLAQVAFDQRDELWPAECSGNCHV